MKFKSIEGTELKDLVKTETLKSALFLTKPEENQRLMALVHSYAVRSRRPVKCKTKKVMIIIDDTLQVGVLATFEPQQQQ